MRTIFALCLLLFSFGSMEAQSRRMANPQVGKTYTSENLASTPWPLLQQAERQLRTLGFQEAFLTFESVVAQYPNSAEALILRARFKKMIGMETEAEEDFLLAKRLNPYAADLYGYTDNIGVLNLLVYKPKNAILQLSAYQKLHYYDDFLDRAVTTDGYLVEEFPYIEQLIEQIEQDNLTNALQTASMLLTQYPPSAIVQDLKGLALAKQNRPEAAMEAFSKAIKIDPGFALSWYNMGTVQHQLGHFEQAKNCLDKAIELEDNLTKAYFERARVWKAMGDKQSALSDYNSIIAQKEAIYPEALLNRGLTKKMTGTYASALTDINKVINEIPGTPEIYKNRGNLYLLLGLVPKAIDDYTKAIQLKSDYTDAYFNRAIAHFLMLDSISGCADLEVSSQGGNAIAKDMKNYFCVN